MKRFVIFLTFVAAVTTAKAQMAEDSVKAAVNLLFTAMKQSDTVMLKNAFHGSAVLQTLARNKEGNVFINNETVSGFAKQVSQFAKDAIDERIEFETVRIDGPIASVWAPYKLYLNGQFIHCGVNSLQLVRINGIWKIQYILDTRRKIGCE
jgi:Putative lumazine-binding